MEVQLADLTAAAVKQKNANIYQRIKFFGSHALCLSVSLPLKLTHTRAVLERKKILRKIRQAPSSPALLKQLRIDLNYILHWDDSQKYVALFPDSTYCSHAQAKQAKAAHTESDGDVLRRQRRRAVKLAMRAGEMDAEPERALLTTATRLRVEGGGAGGAASDDEGEEMGDDAEKGERPTREKKRKLPPPPQQPSSPCKEKKLKTSSTSTTTTSSKKSKAKPKATDLTMPQQPDEAVSEADDFFE